MPRQDRVPLPIKVLMFALCLLLCAIPIHGGLSCDFDGDGFCDVDDIDALAETASWGQFAPVYDMTNDGVLDHDDRDAWLLTAGLANGLAGSYLLGDANLDGDVDPTDLMAVGINWLNPIESKWTGGNFHFSVGIDARDLNELGVNWLRTVAQAEQVPEPVGQGLLLSAFAVFVIPRFRKFLSRIRAVR